MANISLLGIFANIYFEHRVYSITLICSHPILIHLYKFFSWLPVSQINVQYNVLNSYGSSTLKVEVRVEYHSNQSPIPRLTLIIKSM